MGKLFDLMIMGFKLQLMSVSPRDAGAWRGLGLVRGGDTFSCWARCMFAEEEAYPAIQQEIIDVTNNHLEELRRLAGRVVPLCTTHRSGHIGDGLLVRLPL